MTTQTKTIAAAPPKKSKGRSLWLVSIAAAMLSAALLPAVSVVFCGMLPTAVAYLTDRDPQKYAALTVGGPNFCGVLPFAIATWQKGNTTDIAMALLAHPITWLVMLGGAGLGWVIYYSVPPAVSAIVVRVTQAKITGLEERKKKLSELWDPPLASATAPRNVAPAKPVKN